MDACPFYQVVCLQKGDVMANIRTPSELDAQIELINDLERWARIRKAELQGDRTRALATTPGEQVTIRQALAWALAWLDNVERIWGNGPLLEAMPNNAPARDMMRAALAGEPLPVATRSGNRAIAAGEAVTLEILPDDRGVKIWGYHMQDGSTLILLGDLRSTAAALLDAAADLAGVLAGDPDPGPVCEACDKRLPNSTSPYHTGGNPVFLCDDCADPGA